MKSFLMKFSSKQLSNFLFITSLTVFFYLIYKERIVHSGEIFSYYLNYYNIILIFLFFSLFSFFLSKNFKANFILVVSSVLFALYLIEFFLIYQYSHEARLNEKYIKKNNINFDKRTKKEVYLKMKETDPTATITMSPANFVNNISLDETGIYPLSGISNSQTLFCNELGFHVILNPLLNVCNFDRTCINRLFFAHCFAIRFQC